MNKYYLSLSLSLSLSLFAWKAAACGTVAANVNGIAAVATTGQALPAAAAASTIANPVLTSITGCSTVGNAVVTFASSLGPWGWIALGVAVVGASPLQTDDRPSCPIHRFLHVYAVIPLLTCLACLISYLQTARKLLPQGKFRAFIVIVMVVTYLS